MDKRHLMLTLTTFALLMSGCKQEAYPFGSLHCQLTTKTPSECPGVPTLETGTLEISSHGKFELNGHYNACFHIEDVSINGKSRLYKLHNGYALELLGTQFEKTDGSLDKFPKTIGFINLSRDSLQGRFVDLWAMIRSHGQTRQEPLYTNLNCKQVKGKS